MVELIWRPILVTDRPYLQLIYNMANYNKVTNKWKGVGGVKCSDKCLTIIRIIAILFEYPEVKVNMIDGNIKPLTSIL